mgnify:CR=1 FL=1
MRLLMFVVLATALLAGLWFGLRPAPETPAVPVTASGVSAANVVATIDVPAGRNVNG